MTVPSKPGLDVGIVARHVDAMLEFYVDALGLTYVEKLAIPWGTMHRLRFGDSWIKLVEPTADVANGSGPIDAAGGFRYLTLEVDDIDDVWASLMAADAVVYHPLEPFGTKGVVMGMVFDPDGNVVEVLHRPPTAAVG